MSSHEYLEQAAPYVLGALDPGERAAFEAHLAGCDVCRAEVAELSEVAGLLALAPASAAPPPSLRDRIMRDAKGVRPIGAKAQDGTRPALAEVPSARVAQPAWRVAQVVPWLALAASLVGVFVMRSRYENERVVRSELAVVTDSLRAALTSRDSLLSAILAPDVQTVKLTATGRPPSARVYWNHGTSQVVFAAFQLPRAPNGRTYQLWAIEAGNKAPVSLGTFNTGTSGEGRISVRIPKGLQMALSAVTEEPEGGSAQPTTQPFLVGAFAAN